MPAWFLLGLIAAFSSSLLLLVSKKFASQFDPIVALWLGQGFSVLFLIVFLIMNGGWPAVTPLFFVLAAASGCLDTAAKVSTMYAVRRSQLSILAPITAFSPVFAVMFAFLLLQQHPRPLELSGIILIVLGAYGLNLKLSRKRWFEPIASLLRDRGVQLILLVCLIEGLSPIIQTKAIFETKPVTPLAASVLSFIFLEIILWPVAWKRIRSGAHIKRKHVRLAVVYGAFASVMTYTGWQAFSLTNPSYVVAVGKLSVLFGMLWGAWFFREKVTAIRFAAGAIMVVGVTLLVI